jgi:hypothetical protein
VAGLSRRVQIPGLQLATQAGSESTCEVGQPAGVPLSAAAGDRLRSSESHRAGRSRKNLNALMIMTAV